jgi:hypothetical protein
MVDPRLKHTPFFHNNSVSNPELCAISSIFAHIWPAIVMGIGPITFSCYEVQLAIIRQVADRFGYNTTTEPIEGADENINANLWVTMTPRARNSEMREWIESQR